MLYRLEIVTSEGASDKFPVVREKNQKNWQASPCFFVKINKYKNIYKIFNLYDCHFKFSEKRKQFNWYANLRTSYIV